MRLKRRRDGRIELVLPDWQRDLLETLVEQLRALLVADADPHLLRRLYPAAHAADPDADAEYRNLTHDQLLEGRLRAVDTVERTLRSETLEPSEALAWIRVGNDLRLVIGTRLDISEETDLGAVDPDHPDAGLYLAYEVLTTLVAWLVEVVGPE